MRRQTCTLNLTLQNDQQLLPTQDFQVDKEINPQEYCRNKKNNNLWESMKNLTVNIRQNFILEKANYVCL